jgi:hypothetical protein
MTASARHNRPLHFNAILAFLALSVCVSGLHAADPASGTITATTATPLEWDGSAIGGSSAGETTCQQGVNCDSFALTVAGSSSDYAGKLVKLEFSWTLPATDYDFYIHKGEIDGPVVASGSNGGAPATSDGAAITPAASGTGLYTINVVYFSSPGAADEYHAKASITSAVGPSRTARYVTTGIAFSHNVQLKAPVGIRDGEPSNRTDFKGNAYVAGIRGASGGVDLWRFDLNPNSPKFDPLMRVPYYRGQPDAFSQAPGTDFGADGGGDVDLAVGFPPMPSGQAFPTLNFSSLVLANVSTGKSTDGGNTFSQNPVGNASGGAPGDDREWQEFLGNQIVYMWYRTAEPAVTQIQRSTDGGFSFGPAQTAGTTSQVGPIDVHQKDGVVYAGTSDGIVAVGTPSTPKGEPLSTDYVIHQAASDPAGVAHLFFVIKVADDQTQNGTLYACYSNDRDIYLRSSTDKGVTWNNPVRVNAPGLGTKVNVFPWMETGPTTGSVGVAWYGTKNDKNDDKAEWKVYFAQSFNADSATPTFSTAEVTEPEHVIHASNISEGGLTGAANRNLIDYFQVSFDPNGAAVIAYTDDHNDYDGHTYVAHQIAGPSIKTGAALPPASEGSLTLPDASSKVSEADAFPPRVPGLNGEQITDYALDVANGMAVREAIPDPEDVLSVRYDTSGTGPSLAIAATMRLSDLTVLPGQTSWQMNFVVNAPHNVLSPTGTYSFAASDHGDQFYLQADTDVNGAQTFSYGTAERASDGKMLYTKVGDADAGEFNQNDNTVSVQVRVSKLNAILAKAKHPLISNGTVVAGLRGRAYTIEVVPPVNGQASRQGRRDIARGGTQFVVHDYALAAPTPTPYPTPLPKPATPPTEPTPHQVALVNISTRVAVTTGGDEVGIAGFIIRGSGTAPKRVLVRGIGPSLQANGTSLGGIADPTLEVRDKSGALVAGANSNDDWRSSQEAEISATGVAPKLDKEAAVIANLPPGEYTATLNSKGGGRRIGLVEVYDIGAESPHDLANITTRGFVGKDPNVLIGGLIIRDNDNANTPQRIVVRAIGPSLTAANVQGALQDPTIELRDLNGTLIASNDNWRSSQAAALQNVHLAPTDNRESAIIKVLNPGIYTAIVRGKNNATGIALVEAYNLGKP